MDSPGALRITLSVLGVKSIYNSPVARSVTLRRLYSFSYESEAKIGERCTVELKGIRTQNRIPKRWVILVQAYIIYRSAVPSLPCDSV